jgi:hypothetical protein
MDSITIELRKTDPSSVVKTEEKQPAFKLTVKGEGMHSQDVERFCTITRNAELLFHQELTQA